jgi:hypothetical protein
VTSRDMLAEVAKRSERYGYVGTGRDLRDMWGSFGTFLSGQDRMVGTGF